MPPLDSAYRNISSGGFKGNHATHNAAAVASAASCEKCHPGSIGYGTGHRNGFIDISGNINASPHPSKGKYNKPRFFNQTSRPVLVTCSNVNCHFENITPTWGDNPSATSCATCHGAPPSDGSHPKHSTQYGGLSSCKKCHGENATFSHATSVGKRSLRVEFKTDPNSSGTYSGDVSYPHYLPSQLPARDGSCSAIYCHSNGGPADGSLEYKSATWGTRLPEDCTGCHGGNAGSVMPIGSGKHGKHTLKSPDGAEYGCGHCHKGTVTAGNDRAITGAANHADGVKTVVFSSGGSYGATGKTCSGTLCHQPGKPGAPLPTPAWNGTGSGCNACHGTGNAFGRPDYANAGVGAVLANSHGIHARQVSDCGKCHIGTTVTGTTIVSGSLLHTNGDINVTFDPASAGESVTWTAGAKTCANIACHGAGSIEARWGGTGCLSCHSVAQGARAAISQQFGDGNSHHIQGAVTDHKCFQCHWEANNDGSINAAYHGGSAASGSAVDLVVYGAGSRPEIYTAGETAVQYTANGTRGEIEKINNHCLGCHSDRNNDAQPFGDGRTPRQYAWDGTSVAARYSQTGSTVWGKYSTGNVAAKKLSKAYSAHGKVASNQRGWDTANGVDGVIPDSGGAASVQCYDCHNSHGSLAAGVTSRYSSATGRNRGAILKSTVAGQGGYSVAYRPYTSGSAATRNHRNPGANICLDCHLSQSAATTPWGYNSTFGVTEPVLGYWDAYQYKGYSTAGAEMRYPFKKKNSAMGGHFGASRPLTVGATEQIQGLCTPCHDPHGVSPTLGDKQQFAVPLLKGTWVTSPYLEDVAPARNVRLTKRTEVGGEGVKYHIDQNTFASDLRGGEVAGLPFNNVSTAAGLCVGCHTKSSLTDGVTHDWKNKNRIHESVQGWKSTGGTVKHSYTCSKCHSPHTNSTLPRLMVTNCLDSKHKGQVPWSAALISGSGSGQFVINTDLSLRKCSEIPYSFHRDGYAPLGGGWGWCGTGPYPSGTGSGSGRIPGNWSGTTQWYASHSVACHEGNTGNGTDQSWNTVTPWTPAMEITSGPSAALSGLNATISWTTIVPGDSKVSYGLTADYGMTATEATLLLNHAVQLTGLVNHSTYHYRVESASSGADRATSADATFYLSAPPTIPTVVPKSIWRCVSGCPQTMQWNASTDPDNGLIEYQVQIDTSNAFNTPNLQTSPWVSSTSWSSVLATDATWFWRVRSRDANHTAAEDLPSAWSSIDSFSLSSAIPEVPALGAPAALSTTSIRWNFTDTADNETGFSLHDAAHAVKATSASSGLSFLDETGLTANTSYTRHVHSYNGAGDSAGTSPATSYTLSLPPNVTADKAASGWYSTAGVTFTNAAGFGPGGVQYYRYVWDQNPTHAFNDSETQWSSGTLALTSTAPGTWYLHVKSYSGDNVANGTQDYGPFGYDAAAPVGLGSASPAGGATGLSTATVVTAVPATDATSGTVEYYFQVAADGGFTNAVQNSGWQSGTSFSPALVNGTTYYWRVKVRDAALNESPYTAVWSFTTVGSSTTWTTKGDFETNVATTGAATVRSNVIISGTTSGTNADVTLDSRRTVTVATGNGHTLLLKADGSVLATGSNFYGQLGNGTTTASKTAVEVTGLGAGSGIIAVAAGREHSLALKSDGTVLAWGRNNSGQLGDGTSTDSSSPVQVSGLGAGSGVIAISAGDYFSLAVKSDGSMVAWGNNQYGQLCNGTNTGRSTPGTTHMVNGWGIIAVSAGAMHTLALSDPTTGSWVYSCGYNNNGQLGTNTTYSRNVPASVLSGAVSIAAGGNHSVAVKSNGYAYAWGMNNYGQLGDGTTTQRNYPIQIPGVSGMSSAAAGLYHSFLLGSNGTAIGFGLNSVGQIGFPGANNWLSPVPVATGISAVASAPSGNFSMGLKTDGTVLGWGDNAYGQFGDGTTGEKTTPVNLVVSGVAVTSKPTIAAGSLHSVAIKSDGSVVAWGTNTDYELGTGTQTSSYTPVQVSGQTPGSGAASVAVGMFHTLLLKSDGTVLSWGWNYYGQLGDGTNTTRSVPTQVVGLGPGSGVIAVSAGQYYSLALKSDGTVLAWGINGMYQLGDGTTTNRAAPVQVTGLGPGSGVIAISAGDGHALALKSDGTVLGWGYNNYGEVGDGSYANNKPTPVQVSGLGPGSGVIAIAGGDYFSLALKSDGTVLAWGDNYYGQLGDGTRTYKTSPVQVSGFGPGSGTVAIAAGTKFAHALKGDGTIFGWGTNTIGQVGDGTLTQRNAPVPVAGLEPGVVALSAGSEHVLGLKSDGTMIGWGSTTWGQIGDGSYRGSSSPTTNPLVAGLRQPTLYASTGTITGLKVNAGTTANWSGIFWNGTTPSNTAIKFRTRGASLESGLAGAAWSDYYLASGSPVTTPASQWLEVELGLDSTDGNNTPQVGDFRITRTP